MREDRGIRLVAAASHERPRRQPGSCRAKRGGGVGRRDALAPIRPRPGRRHGGVVECSALPVAVGGLPAGLAQERGPHGPARHRRFALGGSGLDEPQRPSKESPCEPPPFWKREAFPFWWADFGCSIRGGSVAVGPSDACRSRVRVHDGLLYILEDDLILQWPLGASSGSVVAGGGRPLSGVGVLDTVTDFDISAAWDLYVLDVEGNRVIKIRDGVGEVVGEGALKPSQSASNLAVGRDGTIYFTDENWYQVMRFAGGEVAVVAGGSKVGASPGHLNTVGGLFVTRDGTLYISDQGNHRVQKWSPGDLLGTTVAGGNGRGSRDDQLSFPGGLFVTEDATIYVADSNNNRVTKWRQGWRSGMVVAGGGDVHDDDKDGCGLHELFDPRDITMDAFGALYVVDDSARVMRWAAPPSQ